MKTTRLKEPKRIRIKGRTFWRVEAPAPGGGRVRKTYRHLADAKNYYDKAKVAMHKFGAAAMGLDDASRADAVRALALLAPHGASLLDAARDYVTRLEAQKIGKPLDDAVKDFLEAKNDTGLSDRYRADLRLRLNRFVQQVPEATTASVGTEQINKFLQGLKLHANTANTFRRDLNTFFGWCEHTGLCQANPAAKATIFKAKAEPITTLSPEKFALMLSRSDKRIRPALVLAGFCALRQAEIARLDWPSIDLDQKVITLDAGATKTNSRRVVTMPVAAVQWLKPLAKKTGRVLSPGADSRASWDLCRLAAGFGPFKTSLLRVRKAQEKMTKAEKKALVLWPDNGLRHTAISARMALSAEDAARAFGIASDAALTITSIEAVAFQAGNSPQVIKTNYLKLMKPDIAREWFAITPSCAQRDASGPKQKHEGKKRKSPQKSRK